VVALYRDAEARSRRDQIGSARLRAYPTGGISTALGGSPGVLPYTKTAGSYPRRPYRSLAPQRREVVACLVGTHLGLFFEFVEEDPQVAQDHWENDPEDQTDGVVPDGLDRVVDSAGYRRDAGGDGDEDHRQEDCHGGQLHDSDPRLAERHIA